MYKYDAFRGRRLIDVKCTAAELKERRDFEEVVRRKNAEYKQIGM